MKPVSMRADMPLVSAFVDACREAFGAAEVNTSIRSALAGGDTFYANENGQTIGKPSNPPGYSVTGDDLPVLQKPKKGNR